MVAWCYLRTQKKHFRNISLIQVLVPETPPSAFGEGRGHMLLLPAQHLFLFLVTTSCFPSESLAPAFHSTLKYRVPSGHGSWVRDRHRTQWDPFMGFWMERLRKRQYSCSWEAIHGECYMPGMPGVISPFSSASPYLSLTSTTVMLRLGNAFADFCLGPQSSATLPLINIS